MFADLFACSARINRPFGRGVNKFTFCEVIGTKLKMPLGPSKSTVLYLLRLNTRIFQVQCSAFAFPCPFQLTHLQNIVIATYSKTVFFMFPSALCHPSQSTPSVANGDWDADL
jgi:hypothetical protein